MDTTKGLVIPNSALVRSEAIQTLVERLGIGKAAFFIRETMSQPLDYLEMKDQLFGAMTVTDICNEIKKN